jgi:hypothetical protein
LLVKSGVDVKVNYGPRDAVSLAELYGQKDIADYLKGVLHSGGNSYAVLHNGDINSVQDKVYNHLKQHFDNVSELSLHEIVGDLKIHVVMNSPDRQYILLATSGAKLRNGKHGYELLVYLPESWNIMDLNDARYHWPVAWLRRIAYYNRKVSPEDIISGEDIYEPLSPSTKYSGFILLQEQEGYGTIERRKSGSLSFMDLIPLYGEELELAKKGGTDKLLMRLREYNMSMVWDQSRKNVGKM